MYTCRLAHGYLWLIGVDYVITGIAIFSILLLCIFIVCVSTVPVKPYSLISSICIKVKPPLHS